MKALVIYDSTYGNTEKIAQAISKTIGCKALRASEVNPVDLKEFDLLVFGSPTHDGWFIPEIKSLLNALPPLEGVKLAAFDTRTKQSILGHAAPRIAQYLESSGGILQVPPEGFLVLGYEGPLVDGELERAAVWAKGIIS